MRHEAAACIDYPRHFMLLVVVSVVLVATQRWRPVLGAVPSLALYGALHSTALVAALRPPQRLRRKAAFITAAICLAMLSVSMARFGGGRLASMLGLTPPAVLLSLCSGLGAASYAVLIRCFWSPNMPRRALTGITLSCMLCTSLALPLGTYLHVVSPTWFVSIWWWAFSLTLWHHGRAQRVELDDRRRCSGNHDEVR